MSTGTFAASSSSLLTLTESYISVRVFSQAGLASLFTKHSPPINFDSINGPSDCIARRPWLWFPVFLGAPPLEPLPSSESMRAALTDGSSEAHSLATSSGIAAMIARSHVCLSRLDSGETPGCDPFPLSHDSDDERVLCSVSDFFRRHRRGDSEAYRIAILGRIPGRTSYRLLQRSSLHLSSSSKHLIFKPNKPQPW